MCLAHLVKGRQLNDCDATSWYAGRANAAAEGVSKSEDCSISVRPAASEDQLCWLAGTFSLRDELSDGLSSFGWIVLLRVESEALPLRREIPAGSTSEMGQASSHSVLGWSAKASR